VGIATELVVICLIVYVPFLQEVFGTAAIPPVYWLFLLAWAPALLMAEECRKGIVRWKESGRISKKHVGDGV